jgi:hypothetical protein
MLGLGDYAETSVRIPWSPDHESASERVRLHQIPLQRALGHPEVWLLGTEAALQKNSVHLPTLGDPVLVRIPEGTSDDQFWSILKILEEKFDDLAKRSDACLWEIHFDLTHGFRTQPMFVLQSLKFLCAVSTAQLKFAGAYYNILDQKKSESQILRVSPILELNDIARDVSVFLEQGVSAPLLNRIQELIDEREKWKAQHRRPDEAHKCLKRLQGALIAFDSVTTLNLTPGARSTVDQLLRDVPEACKSLEAAHADFRPLARALEKLIRDLISAFPRTATYWELHRDLALWNLKQGRLQQALTHAEEVLVTRICEEHGVDPLERGESDGASLRPGRQNFASRVKANLKTEKQELGEWSPLIRACQLVNDLRNRINHADMNKTLELDKGRVHENVRGIRDLAEQRVRELFKELEKHPGKLPDLAMLKLPKSETANASTKPQRPPQ